jgi:hypothetical protein
MNRPWRAAHLRRITAAVEAGESLSDDDLRYLSEEMVMTERRWRNTQDQLEGLRSLLGRLERSGLDGACPDCGHVQDHSPGCELAKAILWDLKQRTARRAGGPSPSGGGPP